MKFLDQIHCKLCCVFTVIPALLGSLFLSSCANNKIDTQYVNLTPNETRFGGYWNNRYKNNKDLVGIWLQQLPDNPLDAKEYAYKHPCLIHYVFADGMQHCINYFPNGNIKSEGWSRAPSWILEDLNIIYRKDQLDYLIKNSVKSE